jgi:hypothetical protein
MNMKKNKRIHVINVKMNYKKSARSSPSAETRWRSCEEAFAATAGPKRREALATEARHQKLGAVFYL